MALATLCPHCGTLFRVASDQLKLRGGIVRCGACHEIFDGSAALVDLDALATASAAATPAPPEAPVAVDSAASATTPDTKPEPQPVYTLDFGHTFDPFGILPQDAGIQPPPAPAPAAAQAVAEPEPAPAPAATNWAQVWKRPAPAPIGYIDTPVLPAPADHPRLEPVLMALPEAEADAEAAPHTDAPALLKRAAATSPIEPSVAAEPPPVPLSAVGKRAERSAARRSKLTPTKIDAQAKLRAADIDEPEFVRRGRQQEQSGRTRTVWLSIGTLVLLLLLLAQASFSFRNTIAAHVPSTKPALTAACALLGCQVSLPAQIDDLVIETGELTTLGGGAYAFTTQLRNGAGVTQAWPSLELALLDANDKPLVRRVFAPTDYLAAGTPLGSNSGIAPRGEQAIKLHFRVDDLKPSGYDIAVFYP